MKNNYSSNTKRDIISLLFLTVVFLGKCISYLFTEINFEEENFIHDKVPEFMTDNSRDRGTHRLLRKGPVIK